MAEQVILVNAENGEIGTSEKLEAHQQGLLHRAFSVYIFNSRGELMLQRRAVSKYHSGGLWTNTCCGHPRPGEKVESAAHRRLREEMGFDTSLTFRGSFIYHANLDRDLVENEYLHVYTGLHDGIPAINPDEADDWRWVGLDELQKEVSSAPQSFTYWFKLTLEKIGPEHLFESCK